MYEFAQFLIEDKNTHLEHVEDEILNNGSIGGKNAISFLLSLSDMLVGYSRRKMNVTVKWDGAPAIFAGTNPENGKFFVGTKAVFNVPVEEGGRVGPLINYTHADIDKNHPGGVGPKLHAALDHFKKLKIPGIWQGDLLFTHDELSVSDVGGEKSIVFTPNTITYAVPVVDDLAKTINTAKIGVVWHTTYSGRKMTKLKAKFGANSKLLKQTKDVWSTDATFRDTSGTVKFTAAEAKQFKKVINMAAGSLKIASPYLRIISKDIKDKNIWTPGGTIKIFLNSYIRGGIKIENTREVVNFFEKFYTERLNKKISTVKTKDGKKKWEQVKQSGLKEYNKYKREFYFVIATYITLQTAKMMIVRKLERAENIGTFIRTPNGYKVTAPEGFVAIDHVGKATKLVDRLEFSRANFTADKNWK